MAYSDNREEWFAHETAMADEMETFWGPSIA